MVRLGKLTDYGLVLMSCMARSRNVALHNARDLSMESGLPVSTVRKLLKELLQSGLLASQRGVKGGYLLAREPRQISIGDIIAALEGPVALTECSTNVSVCEIESCCNLKSNQRIINQAVRGVLEKITLSDLIRPLNLTDIENAGPKVTPRSQPYPGRVQ